MRKAGFASFHFVNVAGDPLVAPFGGADRRISTNPFCAAFPRQGQAPLLPTATRLPSGLNATRSLSRLPFDSVAVSLPAVLHR